MSATPCTAIRAEVARGSLGKIASCPKKKNCSVKTQITNIVLVLVVARDDGAGKEGEGEQEEAWRGLDGEGVAPEILFSLWDELDAQRTTVLFS